MAPVPDNVAVVIPVRFPKKLSQDTLKLENDFSVTILDLPLNSKANICKKCTELRQSVDPLVSIHFNYLNVLV